MKHVDLHYLPEKREKTEERETEYFISAVTENAAFQPKWKQANSKTSVALQEWDGESCLFVVKKFNKDSYDLSFSISAKMSVMKKQYYQGW